MSNELNKRNLEALYQMMSELQLKCYDFTIKMETVNRNLTSLTDAYQKDADGNLFAEAPRIRKGDFF